MPLYTVPAWIEVEADDETTAQTIVGAMVEDCDITGCLSNSRNFYLGSLDEIFLSQDQGDEDE